MSAGGESLVEAGVAGTNDFAFLIENGVVDVTKMFKMSKAKKDESPKGKKKNNSTSVSTGSPTGSAPSATAAGNSTKKGRDANALRAQLARSFSLSFDDRVDFFEEVPGLSSLFDVGSPNEVGDITFPSWKMDHSSHLDPTNRISKIDAYPSLGAKSLSESLLWP